MNAENENPEKAGRENLEKKLQIMDLKKIPASQPISVDVITDITNTKECNDADLLKMPPPPPPSGVGNDKFVFWVRPKSSSKWSASTQSAPKEAPKTADEPPKSGDAVVWFDGPRLKSNHLLYHHYSKELGGEDKTPVRKGTWAWVGNKRKMRYVRIDKPTTPPTVKKNTPQPERKNLRPRKAQLMKTTAR